MWLVFSLFLTLWFVSVYFYLPWPMALLFFGAAIAAATVALMPGKPRAVR